MNTSRDIEKLFDHFGGNAGEYQEIGRENEARSARTRWPLLATLDFAQPAIPGIAPRRDVQLNATRPHTADAAPAPASTTSPTPILRGRQPLFTRPHRRAIPPVNPPAAESLSALRFSAPGEEASHESVTIPDSMAAPVETKPAPVADTPRHEATRPAATSGANFLARRSPAQIPPAAPTPRAPEPAPAAAAAPAASQSILGKLFQPQAQNATSAPANSLDAMFERLRHANPQSSDSTLARRLSRS